MRSNLPKLIKVLAASAHILTEQTLCTLGHLVWCSSPDIHRKLPHPFQNASFSFADTTAGAAFAGAAAGLEEVRCEAQEAFSASQEHSAAVQRDKCAPNC